MGHSSAHASSCSSALRGRLLRGSGPGDVVNCKTVGSQTVSRFEHRGENQEGICLAIATTMGQIHVCSIHHIVALRGLNAICQTWKRNQQTNEVEQLSRPGVVCNTRKRQTRATLLYDCPGLRSLPVASFSGPGNRHLQAKNQSEHKLLHYSCYAWLLLNWVDVPCTSASSWPPFSTVA